MRAVVVAAVLLVAGCGSLERDVGIYGIWAKRGQSLGDLAHLYCEQGARRERDIMAWAIERHAHPAKVTIECPKD